MNKSIIYKEDKDIQEDLRKLKALQQEPCEDCISRQAVIELCEGWWLGHTKEDDFATEVRALPSVNPQEPKCETAKWIRRSGIMSWKWFECDRCTTGYDFATPYCPHCGAKMSEIQTGSESEE